jgi:hypothetical protein
MQTIVIFLACWGIGSVLVGVLLRRWITRLVSLPRRQREAREAPAKRPARLALLLGIRR